EVEDALHAAQKEQQTAVAALAESEKQGLAVGDDLKARDQADQQLLDNRLALEKAFGVVLEKAKLYDDAAELVHRRLLAGIKPKDEAAQKITTLLERRAQAAADLAHARERLKDATVHRAEARASEVSYDGEFAHVLENAFKTAAIRDAFLAKVRPKRD